LTLDARFVRQFPLALLAGLVVCSSLIGLVAVAARRRRDPRALRPLVIWVSLAGYGLASAAVTVAGRLGFGPEYVFTSRYVAFAAPVIVSIAFVAAEVCSRLPLRDGTPSAAILSHGLAAIAGGFVVLSVLNSWECRAHLNEYRRTRLQARALLPLASIADRDDVNIVLSPPRPAELPGLWRRLVARGVLEDLRPRYVSAGESGPASEYGRIEQVERVAEGEYEATGWSYIPTSRRSGDAVLVSVRTPDGRQGLYAALPKIVRSDVVARLGSTGAIISGWQIRFTPPGSADAVEFWTIDGSSAEAHLIGRQALAPGTAPLPPVHR
jgi:hypothetical protein